MDATGLSFTMTSVLSILFGATGAIGVWFKLKGNVNIQEVEINTLKDELKDMKNEYKEDKKSIHKRIDSQKALIEKNRENSDNAVNKITSNMNEMELRIIKAIHDIKG